MARIFKSPKLLAFYVLAAGLWSCKQEQAQYVDQPRQKRTSADGQEPGIEGEQNPWRDPYGEGAIENEGGPEDRRETGTTGGAPDPENNNWSRGSGGQRGQVIDSKLFSHQGLQSQYRIWAPNENSSAKAHGLVVYLHGDTGSNYGPASLDSRIDSGYAAYGQPRPTLDQARFEAAQNPFWNELVFVSVLTPSTNGQFITWSTNLSLAQRRSNAQYVHELVQNEVLAKYNIDLTKVFFVGQSGGGIFVASIMVPMYANSYQGGAVMLCGGAPPAVSFQPNPELGDKFKLHFETTDAEYPDLATDIQSGYQSYQQSVGARNVSYRRQGSGGHCQFPTNSQPTLLEPILKKMMN